MSRRSAPYFVIAGLLIAIEVAIWLLGFATGSVGRARLWVAQYAGFWPGLLHDWQPNFRFQPIVMFATYWLIHSGPVHLLGNLGVMAWLGQRLSPALSPMSTWAIWFASVLGGAAVFGLLSHAANPMIGASGGVFGLLGAYVVVDYLAARRSRPPLRAAAQTAAICVAIVLLSMVDLIMRHAVLAWQTHLGGFLAGAAVTVAVRAPREGTSELPK